MCDQNTFTSLGNVTEYSFSRLLKNCVMNFQFHLKHYFQFLERVYGPKATKLLPPYLISLCENFNSCDALQGNYSVCLGPTHIHAYLAVSIYAT